MVELEILYVIQGRKVVWTNKIIWLVSLVDLWINDFSFIFFLLFRVPLMILRYLCSFFSILILSCIYFIAFCLFLYRKHMCTWWGGDWEGEKAPPSGVWWCYNPHSLILHPIRFIDTDVHASGSGTQTVVSHAGSIFLCTCPTTALHGCSCFIMINTTILLGH